MRHSSRPSPLPDLWWGRKPAANGSILSLSCALGSRNGRRLCRHVAGNHDPTDTGDHHGTRREAELTAAPRSIPSKGKGEISLSTSTFLSLTIATALLLLFIPCLEGSPRGICAPESMLRDERRAQEQPCIANLRAALADIQGPREKQLFFRKIVEMFGVEKPEEVPLGDFSKCQVILNRSDERRKAWLQGHLYHHIALVYSSLQNYAKARHFSREALLIYERTIDDDPPFLCSLLNDFGWYCSLSDKQDEAIEVSRKALVFAKTHNLPDVPFRTTSLSNLAMAFSRKNCFKEAIQYRIDALRCAISQLGEAHDYTLTRYSNLAATQCEAGQFEASRMTAGKILEIAKRNSKPSPQWIHNPNNTIALAFRDEGKFDPAEENFLQAVDLSTKMYGENHPATQQFQKNKELNDLLRRKSSPSPRDSRNTEAHQGTGS